MQASLVFILGFLTAGFIALIVAPMVWRRAVALTRKRIEASVPLTQAEIQADKDRMRAEFAMATRRLEINFKNFREKSAAQIVEVNRNREELKQLMAERSDRHDELSKLEGQAGAVRAELRRREDEIQTLTGKLEKSEHLLERRGAEVSKLGRMYDEASFSASSRQMELAAREAEIEKLSTELATVKSERRELDRRNREVTAEFGGTQEALQSEQERARTLESRIERLLTTIADRDEKIERTEREFDRMRNTVKATSDSEGDLQAQISELEVEYSRLQSEKSAIAEQLAAHTSGAKAKEAAKLTAKISAERDELLERIKALNSENRKLKVDVAVHKRTKSDEWSGERRQSDQLRERMADLAAEVVRLTAALEGPGSPIEKALSSVNTGDGRSGGLAEKIRALQKVAAAR